MAIGILRGESNRRDVRAWEEANWNTQQKQEQNKYGVQSPTSERSEDADVEIQF